MGLKPPVHITAQLLLSSAPTMISDVTTSITVKQGALIPTTCARRTVKRGENCCQGLPLKMMMRTLSSVKRKDIEMTELILNPFFTPAERLNFPFPVFISV